MKVKTKKTKVNKYAKVCAVIGNYDESNEYSEIALENVVMKEFPEIIRRNIHLDHDLTIQVAPKEEIRVFAKNMGDIEEYRYLLSDYDRIKGIFDAFSKHNGPYENGQYIWTTINLEEFKEIYMDCVTALETNCT